MKVARSPFLHCPARVAIAEENSRAVSTFPPFLSLFPYLGDRRGERRFSLLVRAARRMYKKVTAVFTFSLFFATRSEVFPRVI